MNKSVSYSIYLLTLEQGKYYVGRTIDPKKRYEEHLSGNLGSRWTSVYKPLRMKILQKNADVFDEDKYVKIAMTSKGIDNVRGGSYSSFVLSERVLAQLYNEIKNATDRCFNCGEAGHFSSECTEAQVSIRTNPSVTSKSLTVKKCSVCHQPGHNKRKHIIKDR